MDTPIYDFISAYAAGGGLRCHMPGHKGKAPLPELDLMYAPDITEIAGADSLFEADGIILRSERNMASLYGSAACFYSAAGSTLCIQGMLAAMKQEGRCVIAARNVHRSFLNAAALLGLDVIWLMPEQNRGILSGTFSAEAAEELLKENPNACLYITSPDYTGKTADIAALAETAHRYSAPLLVDNAHGAHLRFMPEDCHPMSLGADMCCDSAHKMLPALTGAAVLHSCERYAGVLRQCMGMFASTSPSYLIMASLDLCCRYIDERIRKDIAVNLDCIRKLREHFSGRLRFTDGDPFHITVLSSESGCDGLSLAQALRENGAECEYADRDMVVLLMSPMNQPEDYRRLTVALEKAVDRAERCQPPEPVVLTLPEKVMGIREAAFAPSEEIPVEEAEGRICATVKVPCPPAVPIAACGERIDRSCTDIFRRYGIPTVNVVK
ncbi:MAG: aminotransferase class V-fold PLP-dependent enzyme [Ruminococcus sp.]|nr:aminotransferase class V-fold PLP-dependent enzyme [Ruminococcus sp.]